MTRQNHTIAGAVAELDAEIARLRAVLERISEFHNLTKFGPVTLSEDAQQAFRTGAHEAFAEVAAIAGQALQETT